MKLLFDENPSPRLAARLADLLPGSTHVHSCGLGSEVDLVIWRYAALHGFTIVSKDLDFKTEASWRVALQSSSGSGQVTVRRTRSSLSYV